MTATWIFQISKLSTYCSQWDQIGRAPLRFYSVSTDISKGRPLFDSSHRAIDRLANSNPEPCLRVLLYACIHMEGRSLTSLDTRLPRITYSCSDSGYTKGIQWPGDAGRSGAAGVYLFVRQPYVRNATATPNGRIDERIKGAPAIECRTYTRLVSPAEGLKKKMEVSTTQAQDHCRASY